VEFSITEFFLLPYPETTHNITHICS